MIRLPLVPLFFTLITVMAPDADAITPAEPAPVQQHWECVPIARMLSGIQIRGNAHTWWGQAEGKFRRGNEPRVGAVMAFQPHGNMRLGHVAAVSRIIDDRTVLVTHSNWSLINGRRGQIERNVKVIDVSDAGDWSAVRVWYAPLDGLGTTAWPVHGFIYPDGKAPMRLPDGTSGTGMAPAHDVKPPRLIYADVTRMGYVKPTASTSSAPAPTGRLDYLAKTLK